MANESNLEVVLQELKSFRSRLFKIDLDEDESRDELPDILDNYIDKYQDSNFEPFAEEYLIAGFDVEIVSALNYVQLPTS